MSTSTLNDLYPDQINNFWGDEGHPQKPGKKSKKGGIDMFFAQLQGTAIAMSLTGLLSFNVGAFIGPHVYRLTGLTVNPNEYITPAIQSNAHDMAEACAKNGVRALFYNSNNCKLVTDHYQWGKTTTIEEVQDSMNEFQELTEKK